MQWEIKLIRYMYWKERDKIIVICKCYVLLPKRHWKTDLKRRLVKWLKSRLVFKITDFPLCQEDSAFHLVPWCLWHRCYSKCGPWTSSISVSWELFRQAESQAPRGTCWVRICMLMIPRWFMCTLTCTPLQAVHSQCFHLLWSICWVKSTRMSGSNYW